MVKRKSICVRVNIETWDRFKRFVENIHGTTHGTLGSELQKALEFYMKDSSTRNNTIHTPKLIRENEDQIMINPGIVISNPAKDFNLSGRELETLGKIVDIITDGGKYSNALLSKKAVRNFVGRFVSNYYSIEKYTSIMWNKLMKPTDEGRYKTIDAKIVSK